MHNYEMQEKRQLAATINCVKKGYLADSNKAAPVLSKERALEMMASREKLWGNFEGYELEEAV
ncbi:TPA: hypothetical protein U2I32_000720 [Providencia rettgeri]|nr:hypothetical protein [Providencia rettgeri]